VIELIVNLALCIIILGLGIWGYSKKRNELSLYTGIAFGIFGISHLMKILGIAEQVAVLLIVIRLIAYLLVVFALYRIITKK
jgi:uncharacterized membrane protein (UPF0136 family)